jgi:O-antigen/teichoic acid export membrane protein
MAGLLFSGVHSVRLFALVLLIGNAATWLIAVGFGPLSSVRSAAPSVGLGKELLHYGARVQFGSWASAANVRLDQLLLSLLAPAASLGLYVVAVSYASVLMTIPVSVTYLMLPEVVRHGDATSARACVAQWCRRVFWASIAAGVALAGISVVAIPMLFGDEFRAAAPVAVLLIPATIILGTNLVFATAFQGIGQPEVGSTSEVVALAVTVAGLAALLPVLGIYGAAIASLLAYSARHVYLARKAIVTFGMSAKQLYLPHLDDVAMLLPQELR